MVGQKDNLAALISKKKWTKILERITSHPEETEKRDKDGYLPIHHGCWCADFPVKVIESLISAYPSSVEMKSPKGGLIPLHYAVSRKSSAYHVVQVLLWHYKEGASIRDVHGRTPLLYHLFHAQELSLPMTKMLVEAHPGAVRIRDKHLRYPLHFAAKSGNWEVSQYLVQLYPEALLARTRSHRTPQDVADTFGRHFLREKLGEEEAKLLINSHPADTLPIEDTHASRATVGQLKSHGEQEPNIINPVDSMDEDFASLSMGSETFSDDRNHNDDFDHASYSSSDDIAKILHTSFRTQEENASHGENQSLTEDTKGISEGAMNNPPVPTLIPAELHENTPIYIRGEQAQALDNDTSLIDATNTRPSPMPSVSYQTLTHSRDISMIDADFHLTPGNPSLMPGFIKNLEEAEAFWNVIPLSSKCITHRIHTIEQKVFQESRTGGLRGRLLDLFFVDGKENGSWAEWMNEMEVLLLNAKQKGSIWERIENLEVLVEGEVQTGNILDRVFALNQMRTEFLGVR